MQFLSWCWCGSECNTLHTLRVVWHLLGWY